MRVWQWLGIGATVAATIVTSAFNWRFFSGLATDPLAGTLLGAGSVALDLMKIIMPVLVAGAIAERAFARAAGGTILFVGLFLSGTIAAMGFASESASRLAATRETVSAALREHERDQEDVRGRLARLPVFRPPATVAAEIRALQQDRWFSTSKGCSEATAPASRDLCARLERLRGEAATAAEAAVLEVKAERLKADIAELRTRHTGEPDPQATAIGRLLRTAFGFMLDPRDVRSGLSAFTALMLELVSSFGLLFSGVRHRPRPAPDQVAPSVGRGDEAIPTLMYSASPDASASRGNGDPAPTPATATIVEATSEAAALPPPPSAGEPATSTTLAPAESDTSLSILEWTMQRARFSAAGVLAMESALADYRTMASDAGKEPLPAREFRRELKRAALELDLDIFGDDIAGLELIGQGASLLTPPTEQEPVTVAA